MRRSDFQQNRAKLEDTSKQLRKDFDKIASTDEGRAVLTWLMNQCGFHESSASVDQKSGEILFKNMMYDEGRRNLWLETRKFIEWEHLVKIELPEPLPVVDQETEEE